MEKQNPNKIKITIDEKTSVGVYSNNTIINFNKTEFMLDFAMFQPQNGVNKVQSRVIMHPENITALISSLNQTLTMYNERISGININNKGSETIQWHIK